MFVRASWQCRPIAAPMHSRPALGRRPVTAWALNNRLLEVASESRPHVVIVTGGVLNKVDLRRNAYYYSQSTDASTLRVLPESVEIGLIFKKMARPIRVAVVNSHPIQYFAPLYAYLNRDPGLEVTALYCSDFSLRNGMDPGFNHTVTWDLDLLEGYPYVFVGSNNDRGAPRGFWSLTCPRIWSEIRSGK